MVWGHYISVIHDIWLFLLEKSFFFSRAIIFFGCFNKGSTFFFFFWWRRFFLKVVIEFLGEFFLYFGALLGFFFEVLVAIHELFLFFIDVRVVYLFFFDETPAKAPDSFVTKALHLVW